MLICVDGHMFKVPGILVSSTDKIDRHDITEMFLKVALSATKPNQTININKKAQL
jgi:hypothetical protein